MLGSFMNFASDDRVPPGWFGIRVGIAIVAMHRYYGVPPITANGAVLLFNPAELDANTKAIVDALNKAAPDDKRPAVNVEWLAQHEKATAVKNSGPPMEVDD
jgi:hypothetical protein